MGHFLMPFAGRFERSLEGWGRSILPLLLLSLITVAAQAGTTHTGARPAWSSWVVKIEVVRLDGVSELGSGVAIGPQRVITNCHVVRNAGTIRVSRGDTSWPATMDAGDEYRDLCFLRVPDYPGAPPQMAEPEDARVGIRVFAVGYPGGDFAVSEGQIKGLYTCVCDGGRVIQTSAYFAPGASGGGLFDSTGRLLGILTYKSTSGGNYHFAVPIGWMKVLGKIPPQTISGKTTFWESATRDSGYFLVACDLEAREKWRSLLGLSQDWTRQEPDNPQAWMAWGRANLNLNHLDEAVRGFRRVLLLDSTHTEAQWELQKLEIELGRPLIDTGVQ
jgi:serine protease Do